MKNNKGYALTEILILSTVIIGVLTFMYIQFKNINRGYQNSFNYDTVEGLYLANNILNYINSDGYDTLVESLNNSPQGYIDITNCDVNLFEVGAFCEELFNKSKVKQVLFTEENLYKIKSNMLNIDNDMKNYIKQIKTTNDTKDYRIIVKYDNNTFASLRFNKGNEYVQKGLIAHLDGINNTGNGHSNDTVIWKDLSGNNNDATLYNNPTWSNNSLTFNGIDNYGRLENTANMEFPNGTTWEVRIKIVSLMDLNTSNSTEFFGSWEVIGGGGLSFNTNNNFKVGLYLSDSNNNTVAKSITSDMQNNINQLYTLTVVYDNQKLKIYINSLLAAETSYEGVLNPAVVPFAIGGNPNTTGMDRYANVEFQNVLIYNRALSENEVARNYQADMARY